jgi:hypothetical protein
VVGQLKGTGLRPGFLEKFDKRGVSLPSWLSAPVATGQVPRPRAREALA